MRILALTWKYPWDPTAGGAERYLLEVCRRWAEAGHEVTIFGPRDPLAYRAPPDLQIDGLQYVGRGSRLTVFRAAQRYLHRKGHLYDRVLETVSTRPFVAHRVVGDKAVALYHQTAEEVWTLEFPLPVALLGRHLLEPFWIRQMRPARVVANSPSTAIALQRFGVQCTAIVPPGCDAPKSIAIPSSPSPQPNLLWIGRMVRAKRPQDAMSAMGHIRAQCPDATLHMIGGGYLYAQLSKSMQAGVKIHGPLAERDKCSLLACADLLLLPGTSEGWGIVAMEAAAFGVPVVAYDIAGVRDAVVDGITGVLVEPSPAALATAACRVLSDHAMWRRLSAAARERALTYSWDRCAMDLLGCLIAPSTSAEHEPGTSGQHPSHPWSPTATR